MTGGSRSVFTGAGTTGGWGALIRACDQPPARPAAQAALARLRETAIFGSRHFADVVAAVARLTADGDHPVTVRAVAAETGLGDSAVRPAMRRLGDAGLLACAPRERGARGPVRYRVRRVPLWEALVAVCAVAREGDDGR